MRIIPETNDGIFIAVDAVIPEKITAIVMITADQKPKDISLWFISNDRFDDSFLDMIFLHNYLSDGWQLCFKYVIVYSIQTYPFQCNTLDHHPQLSPF